MSGFFERIARQANGASQTRLRSALQLPFAEIPTDTASPLALADSTPDTALHSRLSDPNNAAVRERKSTSADRNAIASKEAFAASNTLSPPDKPLPHQPLPDAPTERKTNDQSPSKPVLLVPDVARRVSEPNSGLVLGKKGESLEDYPATPPSEDVAPQPGIKSPQTRPAQRPGPDFRSLDALPDPLVPERSKEEPEAWGHQGSRTEAIPSERLTQPHQPIQTAQEPEVHVHIGRVEVTSVAEPAPSAPQRPRRRAPRLSLEEHLARRGGNSS